MSIIWTAKIWEKHSAIPRGVFFCWKDSNRSWNGSNSALLPALKFIDNMIYLQAPAGPVWEGHVASALNSITCMGSVIFLCNIPVIKWNWDKGHCKAQISSKCALCRDVNVNAIKSVTFTASLPSWCSVHLRESWLTSSKSVNLSNVRSALFQHVQAFWGDDQFSSAPLPGPKLFLFKRLFFPAVMQVYGTCASMLPVRANTVPVLELMVSLPITCPSKSYWFSLEPSSATETDLSSPWVHR